VCGGASLSRYKLLNRLCDRHEQQMHRLFPFACFCCVLDYSLLISVVLLVVCLSIRGLDCGQAHKMCYHDVLLRVWTCWRACCDSLVALLLASSFVIPIAFLHCNHRFVLSCVSLPFCVWKFPKLYMFSLFAFGYLGFC